MFSYAFALLERVKVDRKGVTAMEYGVIAAAIVVAVATAAGTVATNLKALFSTIAGEL
jgi:pilus assembly protein Flp/PilA